METKIHFSSIKETGTLIRQGKLSLAIQIVGKPWDDGTVLRLAHQYETIS